MTYDALYALTGEERWLDPEFRYPNLPKIDLENAEWKRKYARSAEAIEKALAGMELDCSEAASILSWSGYGLTAKERKSLIGKDFLRPQQVQYRRR